MRAYRQPHGERMAHAFSFSRGRLTRVSQRQPGSAHVQRSALDRAPAATAVLGTDEVGCEASGNGQVGQPASMRLSYLRLLMTQPPYRGSPC